MDAIRRIFFTTPEPVRPARVESDEIFPVHKFDAVENFHKLVLSWTLRYDDVLDPDKLHGALAKLLDKGDWRKLGGRVRKTDDGGFEIYVPTPYTEERPPVTFTRESFNIPIAEHPEGSKIPKFGTSEHAALYPTTADFGSLSIPPNTPHTLQSWLDADRPQLSLHVVSFEDATLISLSWPHTLMDGMARRSLLQAWSLMLAGKEDEIPPFEGAHKDIVYDDVVGKRKDEKLDPHGLEILSKYYISGFLWIPFLARRIADYLWQPTPSWKTLYFPSVVMEYLRAQRREQLGKDEDIHEVNDTDMIAAWVARIVSETEADTPRPVTLLSDLDMRLRMPDVFHHPDKAYITNMGVKCHSPLTVPELQGTLGQTALAYRRTLNEQGSPEYLVPTLAMIARAEGLPRFMETNTALLAISNANRAKFFEVDDFSAAVVKNGAGSASGEHGKFQFQELQMVGMTDVGGLASLMAVSGADFDGGMWFKAGLRPKAWALLEKELEKLDRLSREQ